MLKTVPTSHRTLHQHFKNKLHGYKAVFSVVNVVIAIDTAFLL
mgnify:CR=1 FL=1